MCRAEDGDEKNYFIFYSALSYNVIYSIIWTEIVPEREKDSSAPALDNRSGFPRTETFQNKIKYQAPIWPSPLFKNNYRNKGLVIKPLIQTRGKNVKQK